LASHAGARLCGRSVAEPLHELAPEPGHFNGWK
jgi:hypothetical protein